MNCIGNGEGQRYFGFYKRASFVIFKGDFHQSIQVCSRNLFLSCNSGSFSSIAKKKALPTWARLINSFRVQNIGT